MSQKRYVIWNNKGGVGKTLMTFALSTSYANNHPEEKVVVIDMCPQANISEILLGGNGAGEKNISDILAQDKRKTIGGYFDYRISRPDEKIGIESDFLIEKLEQYKNWDNEYNLPKNLCLICGDPSLELQVQSINQIASIDLPKGRWKNVHRWLCDIQEAITARFSNQNVTFFIDCNPSFATYTAQAILASEKLIIPCTADASSARAINNIMQLLYGENIPSEYSEAGFASKAEQNSMSVPVPFLAIFNRSTTSSKGPSRAFQAMYSKIETNLTQYQNKKGISIKTENMPDIHTAGIISAHLALPLYKVEGDKEYDIGSEKGTVKSNSASLTEYKNRLKEIVDIL